MLGQQTWAQPNYNIHPSLRHSNKNVLVLYSHLQLSELLSEGWKDFGIVGHGREKLLQNKANGLTSTKCLNEVPQIKLKWVFSSMHKSCINSPVTWERTVTVKWKARDKPSRKTGLTGVCCPVSPAERPLAPLRPAGGPHARQPTASPSGSPCACCWACSPSSPARSPARPGRGRCTKG